ncbi:hypothetical protein FE257_004912 [Aspergillus nanangensis]|uniref:Heterokaryon incompatibility domain-containing protein n=1 Tax=Aspergillus nanangensis TaxID=2582783 RepID=A0AAD4GP21_ASPNN|nr:hypothetical protein FE257_004912 [Aspergillus nanangensis]
MICSTCRGVDLEHMKRTPKGYMNFPYDARMNPKLPGGGLFILKHPRTPSWSYHSRYTDIGDRANAGCVLCKLMYKSCRQFRNNLSSDDKYRYQYKRDLDDFKVYVAYSDKYYTGYSYWTNSDEDNVAFLIGEIGMVTSDEDPLGTTLLGRPISSDPKTTLSRFHALVDSCNNDHDDEPDLTNALAGTTPLPKRVLDLRGGKNRLKLWQPPTGTKAKYVTLSYRWPEQRITTYRWNALNATTSSNVGPRSSPGAMSWAQLNETYQDIVDVALELAIDYVWIDALCIIQNSPADKNAQLAQMGTIYRNSYLNICASDGLRPFAARDGSSRPGVLEYTTSFPKTMSSGTGSIQAFEVPYPDAMAGNQVQGFPQDVVSQRGWTFQERVLSPRTLYFSRTQVYLECGQYCTGEDGFFRPGGFLKIRPSNPSTPSFEYWWSLVAMYSTRDLGFASDKLVAIGGLAAVFMSTLLHPPTTYAAGLWAGPHFLGDLLWSASGAPEEKLDWESVTNRAPSWSWAAVDGLVSPPVHEYRFCHQIAQLVEGPVVQPKSGGNNYTEIDWGYVKIYGPRIKAFVAQKMPAVRLGDGADALGDRYRLVTKHGTVLSRGAFLDYTFFADDLSGWSLSLLIIGKVRVDGEVLYLALVLIPRGSDYRRIGTVEISRNDLGPVALDDHPEVAYYQYQIF